MAAEGKRATVVPLRPRSKCPICSRPSEQATHPFCSNRCARIDLNRWLSGSYAIPGEPVIEAQERSDGREED